MTIIQPAAPKKEEPIRLASKRLSSSDRAKNDRGDTGEGSTGHSSVSISPGSTLTLTPGSHEVYDELIREDVPRRQLIEVSEQQPRQASGFVR